MTVPPLAIGVVAGLLAGIALAPAAADALAGLAQARTHAAQVAADAAAPAPASLVAPEWAIEARSRAAAAVALASRVRTLAASGGVLVESVAPGTGSGPIARVEVRLSGSERAVLALAATLEREPPLTRFAQWRIEATQGGVRLTGEVVAPWR